jgi:aryl-alcohol dehydrogenase (NADP+)
MEYTRLGRSNLLVSRLWLGGMSLGSPQLRPWVADRDQSRQILVKAVELGINAIDTADAYCAGESEALIGEVVGEMGLRDELVIATKFGLPVESKAPNRSGYSRKYIVRRVEDSLRRLRTDHIDILQTHIWNAATDVEEVATAFDGLIRQGKVLYAGITDIPAWQVAKWIYYARYQGLAPLTSVQHHYNAVWREDERALIPLCQAEGVGLVAYSPLARGFLAGAGRATTRERTDELTGRFYGREADARLRAEMERLAAAAGQSCAELALLWTLRQPHVTSAVVGPTSVDQLIQLVGALDKDVDPKTLQAISELYAVRPEAGHG